MCESLTPVPLADIEAARADSPASPCERRSCVSACRTPAADLAQAREPAADRLVQAAGRRQRDGRRRLGRADERRVHGERRKHGPGLAWGARADRRAVPGHRPGHAPATKIAAIERLGGEVIRVPVRRLVADDAGPPLPRDRGPVHPPVRRRRGDGRQRDDRARDPRGRAGRRRDLVPYGGGGLSCGIASAVRASRPDVRVYAAEVETAAPFSAALADGEPTTISIDAELRRRHRRQERVRGDVAAGPRACSRARSSPRWPRSPQQSACSQSATGSSPKAPERQPCATAVNRTIDAKTIVCVISGGNIDSDTLATILRGEIPRRSANRWSGRILPGCHDARFAQASLLGGGSGRVDAVPVGRHGHRRKRRTGARRHRGGDTSGVGEHPVGARAPRFVAGSGDQVHRDARRHAGVGGENGVYVEYFPSNLPARSAFGASGLALGARVEIERSPRSSNSSRGVRALPLPSTGRRRGTPRRGRCCSLTAVARSCVAAEFGMDGRRPARCRSTPRRTTRFVASISAPGPRGRVPSQKGQGR